MAKRVEALLSGGASARVGVAADAAARPPAAADPAPMPATRGALVYYDRNLGRTLSEPPPGSTPLQARHLGEPSADETFSGSPPRFPAKLNVEAQSLRWTGWMPLFEDIDNNIFLYHTETGSVRASPCISLCD